MLKYYPSSWEEEKFAVSVDSFLFSNRLTLKSIPKWSGILCGLVMK